MSNPVESEQFDINGESRIHTSISVGQSGLLYRFSNGGQDAMANEIGQGYARRQNFEDKSRRNRMTIDGILTLLGIIGGAMDVTTASLAMPTPIVNRVTHRVTFKNDADIILVPSQINMPNRYYYSSGTTILFPGEVSTCVVTYQQSSHNLNERMSFAFAAISTDTRILPENTPDFLANVFPFEVWIGRTASRTTLTRVEGYVDTLHDIYGLDTNALSGVDSNLQYVGFRGRANTTMPSFGIAAVDVRTASQTPQTMSTQITFTPLDLRA